jgi:hypothetical protein
VTDATQFVCPFCARRPIRCTCEDPWKYDEPIIECERCHCWMHKSCAGFTFGPNPRNFRCWLCEPISYHIPPFFFRPDSKCKDTVAHPTFDRAVFLGRLPEGELRDKFAGALNGDEIPFRGTVCSFLNDFAPCLFEYTRDFWKTFVTALADLLCSERSEILAAIDEVIVNHWYLPLAESPGEPIPGLDISDAILPNIEAEPLPKIDKVLPEVQLALTEDKRVILEKEVEHGGFICDVPGLLCHEDEIDASQGIPRSCVNIAGTQIVIDVSRSTNPFIQHIRRSFHYNCLAKIVRVAGNVRVGLYATGMKGPILEDKSPRGIAEHTELLLSMDADLPYAVDKPFWKAKKAKPTGKPRNARPKAAHPPPKGVIETRTRPKKKEAAEVEPRTMKTRSKADFPFSLTLLSAFCEDACPPMPLILRDDKEKKEDPQAPNAVRARLRAPHPRSGADS